MTTATVTSNQVAKLYSGGKSVDEVAQELGITYGKARKLIAESGTPIRNTSDRLKGKTRKVK
jgi:transposase